MGPAFARMGRPKGLLTIGRVQTALTAAVVWILAGGVWNDSGVWDDASAWID